MSDSTRDPIQDLEHFGTGGIAVNPLEPAQVRRLGDRRRARRRTAAIGIAAVAAVAVALPVTLLGHHGSSTDGMPPVLGSTFPTDGVTVKSQADLTKLVGTTDEFKSFIGTVLEKDRSTCPQPEIDVMKYDETGFATGGVGGCGGYQALWVLQNGRWKEALATQDQWRCGDLNRFSVPEGFAGDCYGSPVLFGPDTVAEFSIGMTTEQVQAAGGVIQGDPAGDCAGVTMPGVIATTNAPLQEVEMTFGKVIAMWAGKNVVTPQGIALGSTEDEVKQAYPDGHYDIHHYWHAAIDDGSEYEIGVSGDKTVSELLIQTTGIQRCYG